MATMNYLIDTVRQGLKNQSALLVKPFGLNLLTKTETERYLDPFQVGFSPGSPVELPATHSVAGSGDALFEKSLITTPDAYVWRCERNGQKMSQLRAGSVQIKGNVLNTDFGTSAIFKNLLSSTKRADRDTTTLIAPWSHYWGGYFDYLLFVAAKLCRIKDAVSETRFAESLVSYPLLNTTFERELLSVIGLPEANIVDSRTHAVHFDACILGNTGSWFYPNRADVLSLRNHVSLKMPAPGPTPERLYISRSGRRRVLNEPDLIRVLERYGFSIIEDRPRTLAEQYALYHNASFIMGPHGASFANTVWCRPGAHLFELFAPDYVPEYFRYLSHVMGMNYQAYCNGSVKGSRHSNVDQNIYVSIDQVEKHLNAIFAQTSLIETG